MPWSGEGCLDLVVAIRLRLSASKLERISGVGSPKEDDVGDETADLTLESETHKDLSKSLLTARLLVRLFHALEPVRAGRPTSARAVLFS